MTIRLVLNGGTDFATGEAPASADMNDTFNSINRRIGQTINAGVSVGNLVTYDPVNSEWNLPYNKVTPLGMMAASGVITLQGYIRGLTGLTAGKLYYSGLDGTISTTSSVDKIGFALSTTELLLDIDSTSYVSTTWLPSSNDTALTTGGAGGITNVMEYITITSASNSSNFGYLSRSDGLGTASASSSSRGLFAGGNGVINTIDFISFACLGNTLDFGDLTVGANEAAALSNETRAVVIIGGGNVMCYVTINTLGNATDFGDLRQSVISSTHSACASTTRGIINFGRITGPTTVATIDYIEISTPSDSLNFGSLTTSRYAAAACSSNTRGICGGGASATNVIDYITIASTGNATDFGDLTLARYFLSATSNNITGIFLGGYTGSADTNIIEYITIASTGNATDFGDLIYASYKKSACSNSHGGL